MRLALARAVLVLVGAVPAASAAVPQALPRLVVVTAGDDMKFSVTEILAKPGETLKIRLAAVGTAPKAAMAHNLTVLRPGTNQIAFVEAAAQAKATDYIPAALRTQMLADTELRAAGVIPAGVWELGSSEAVKRAARVGLGVAFLSRYAVAEEIERAELEHFRLAGRPPLTRQFSIARLAGRPLSPGEQAFVDTLGRCCAKSVTYATAYVS